MEYLHSSHFDYISLKPISLFGWTTRKLTQRLITVANGDVPRMDVCHHGDANGDAANNYAATEFGSLRPRKKSNQKRD
jgi:hypothetical protein